MVEKTYIEREPIIQFIEHGLNEKKFGYDAIEILGEIQFAPAADVAPVKRGHWKESANLDECFWICSECRFCSVALAAPNLYQYCPNCGARMDGDADANSNDDKTPET